MHNPHIYIGTDGYSDTDLVDTLYPFGTDKTEFWRFIVSIMMRLKSIAPFMHRLEQKRCKVW